MFARSRPWLVTVAVVAATVVLLRVEGRLWWCACGSPALWVGDEALTSADVSGLTYHFFAFEPNKLKPNAPISLGWSSPSERRKETHYRFAIPGV